MVARPPHAKQQKQINGLLHYKQRTSMAILHRLQNYHAVSWYIQSMDMTAAVNQEEAVVIPTRDWQSRLEVLILNCVQLIGPHISQLLRVQSELLR